MDNSLVLMIVIFAVVSELFTLTIGIYANNKVFAKYYKPQTVEQVNNCGNNAVPTNITCSNSDPNTQIQKNINNITMTKYSFLPFP